MASARLNIDLSERKEWVRETVHKLIEEHFAESEEEDEQDIGTQVETTQELATQEVENAPVAVSSSAKDATKPLASANPPTSADGGTAVAPGAGSDPSLGLRLVAPKNVQRGLSTIVQLDDSAVDFQNDTGVVRTHKNDHFSTCNMMQYC